MDGMTLEKLQVIIEAYTKPYRDELEKAKKQTSAATAHVERQTSKMRNSFRKIGGVVAAALGVGAIIKFGKSCIDLGSDLQEVQNVVDVTFGSMSKRVDAFSKKAISQFGLSELTAKKYMGTYGAMAKSFGIVEEAGYQMSASITGLTGDVASFYNLSTDEAYTKLKSIFTGETESLKELGVVMTQTALDQYALNNGFGKTTVKMTEQEKVMLRYRFVMSSLSDASGDFVRTSGSWANQVRILTLQFESLKATIGQGLINAFTPLIRVLNTVLAKLQTLAAYFKAFTSALFGDAGGSDAASGMASSMASAAGSSGDVADNMGSAAKSAKDMKKSLAAFDEINNLTGDSGSGGSGGGGGGAAPDFGSFNWDDGDLVEKFEKEFDSLYGVGEYFGNVLAESMGRIDWDKIYQGARGFGTGLADFLNGLISPELFAATGHTVAGALNTAIYAALAFGENFEWKEFGLSIAAGINEFFKTADTSSLGLTVTTFVNGILDTLIEAAEKTDWVLVGNKIGDFLAALDWETILGKAGRLVVDGLIAALSIALGSADKAPLETALYLWIASSIGSLSPFAVAKGLVKKIEDAVKTALSGGITLDSLMITIGNILLTAPALVGTASFDVIAQTLMEHINKALQKILPSWAFEFLSNVGAGIALGAVAGSWFPGAGTVAGAIIGGIIGALNGIQIDGTSILKKIADMLFNFDTARHFFDEAKKSFDAAFNAETFGELGKNILMGILEGFVAAFIFIGEPFADLFEAIIQGICDVFGIHSPAENMKPYGEYILLGIIEGFRATFASWTGALEEWFNQHIAPWFTAKKWSDLYETMKTQMKGTWDKTTQQWKTDISGWWERDVKSWFTVEKWASGLSGVKGGFEKAFSSAFDAVKQLWNHFAEWLNSKLEFDMPSLDNPITGEPIFGGGTITLGRLPTFASGGFPSTGQMFIARESGPEFVGRIGGRNAVANNDQIVDAISRGVYMAMSSAGGSGMNEETLYRALKRALQETDFAAVMDSDQAFRTMQKKAADYRRRTGKPAFEF